MNEKNLLLLSESYQNYNETLKPLLAQVEALYEAYPTQILNELRSFNDHIARCFLSGVTSKYIVGQISKAQEHLDRSILDCFKFINVKYHDHFEEFEKSIRNIDITTISNGEFHVRYSQLRQDKLNAVHEAKRLETIRKEDSFKKFEEAYNLSVELSEFIRSNYTNIKWARIRFHSLRGFKFILWLLASIISGIVSAIIACSFFKEQLLKLIEHIRKIF